MQGWIRISQTWLQRSSQVKSASPIGWRSCHGLAQGNTVVEQGHGAARRVREKARRGEGRLTKTAWGRSYFSIWACVRWLGGGTGKQGFALGCVSSGTGTILQLGINPVHLHQGKSRDTKTVTGRGAAGILIRIERFWSFLWLKPHSWLDVLTWLWSGLVCGLSEVSVLWHCLFQKEDTKDLAGSARPTLEWEGKLFSFSKTYKFLIKFLLII